MMGNSLERGGGGAGGLLGGPRMTPPRPQGMGPMSPGAYAAGMRGPPPQGPGKPLLLSFDHDMSSLMTDIIIISLSQSTAGPRPLRLHSI